MKKRKGTSVPELEMRTAVAKPMTVRTTSDGSKQVAGYAIVWNSPSCDLGGFTELCAPTMLNRTLKESPDVLALRDHKQELLLGRTTAGTLELKTDDIGLAFTVTLPKTQIGDDTAVNVANRNLSGVSFGFNMVQDSWSVDAEGNPVRTLLDVILHEISITSFPAYPGTSVAVRSCPASLRSKLKLRKKHSDDLLPDDDDDDLDDDLEDEDEDEDRDCECPCGNCIDGACELCTGDDGSCGDEDNCIGCPLLDESRADCLRLHRLAAIRVK